MRTPILRLLLLCFITPLIDACSPPTNSSSSPLTLGTDGPADIATNGYNLNHLGLIISNATATLHFYGKILGLRHIFTFHASPSYDIIYMGYSHGGKNGSGYETGEQLYSQKTNSEGLIEFIYPKNATTRLEASTIRANTFSHVGIVVPDVRKAEERMKEFGVQILKGVGTFPAPDDPAAKVFGLGDSAEVAEEALEGIRLIGFEDFLIVADPDGNAVEIQQQV
jgi:lactoylglutathione lyase